MKINHVDHINRINRKYIHHTCLNNTVAPVADKKTNRAPWSELKCQLAAIGIIEKGDSSVSFCLGETSPTAGALSSNLLKYID